MRLRQSFTPQKSRRRGSFFPPTKEILMVLLQHFFLARCFLLAAAAGASAPPVAAFQTTAKPYRSRLQQQSWRAEDESSTVTTALTCQLLGMNCAGTLQFAMTSWPEFCQRGGATDIHSDGWGLAYYDQDGPGLRQFHDLEAASTSPLAQFLGQQSIETRNLLAHIRYATSGTVDLANVHPFARECV